jgi:hypothetical protein
MGALFEPGLKFFLVELNRGRVGVRIIKTKIINKTTIPFRTSLGDDDFVGSKAFFTGTGKFYLEHKDWLMVSEVAVFLKSRLGRFLFGVLFGKTAPLPDGLAF